MTMSWQEKLCQKLEAEEHDTVGKAFGGTVSSERKAYSVSAIRNWIVASAPYEGSTLIERSLRIAYKTIPESRFSKILSCLIRFSFLIELTNLQVGSTKMKTRWMPGKIKVSKIGSFESEEGMFEPGTDPRSVPFDECAKVFTKSLDMVCNNLEACADLSILLDDLHNYYSVPYEFPIGYEDPNATPVHDSENLRWIVNDDIRWLVKARQILHQRGQDHSDAIRKIIEAKLKVKLYKTDRSLTGKDKTNRARRYEVLAEDFQHASLEDCWSTEKKLITDLVNFEDFPQTLKDEFVQQELTLADDPRTLCPVTLEALSFKGLTNEVLDTTHGTSAYQIGHLRPLKSGGKHTGDNVCWQSEDGNRIQGNKTIDDTRELLRQIAERTGYVLPTAAPR